MKLHTDEQLYTAEFTTMAFSHIEIVFTETQQRWTAYTDCVFKLIRLNWKSRQPGNHQTVATTLLLYMTRTDICIFINNGSLTVINKCTCKWQLGCEGRTKQVQFQQNKTYNKTMQYNNRSENNQPAAAAVSTVVRFTGHRQHTTQWAGYLSEVM